MRSTRWLELFSKSTHRAEMRVTDPAPGISLPIQ
jgi:hypothetical protein